LQYKQNLSVDRSILSRTRMSMGWISEILATLPAADDVFFYKLWAERRLMFDGLHSVGDVVDECSTRLVATALKNRKSLLVVLPDSQPHRPAYLLATALISNWLDTRSQSNIPPAPILYFGAEIGIRDQLRRTTIKKLDMSLSDVFSQKDISRGALRINHKDVESNLPHAVTVYAPADPIAIIREYNPQWIAIDFGDASSLCWIDPLMSEAKQRGITVVAWGQNQLSECRNAFTAYGQIFAWPPRMFKIDFETGDSVQSADSFLNTEHHTLLSPMMVDGKGISAFCNGLREAGQLLYKINQKATSKLVGDAVAVHWRYLRSLEALTVPIDFYEAEAPRFWGLKSFGQLRSACEHFRSACKYISMDIYSELEYIGCLLDDAKVNIENNFCAFWEALSNYCVEEPANDEARVIVFTSDARKQLFVFALLARHNFTEDDLRELRTYVLSLNELRRCVNNSYKSNKEDIFLPSKGLTWHPVIAGLPSPLSTSRLLPLFLNHKMDILLYPHQYPSFARRQAVWSELLSPQGDKLTQSIANVAGLPEPEYFPQFPSRLVVATPIEINIETSNKTTASPTGSLWDPDDAVSEVARLFETDDEIAGEELCLTDQNEHGTVSPADFEAIWCNEAIKINFEYGWYAFFAPDDIINVIRIGSGGNDLEQRYIRSLRVNDRVLLIHGQQRQNLYELIISRVHRHPSIELHLAMIRRWQEDIRVAFQNWQGRGGKDLQELLRQMQERGSKLSSTLALSFWLKGYVLCPLDPEDLRRVAEILDMGFVRQFHARIAQAANRLRGLHRGMSKRLNRWLEDHAAGVTQNDDDVIDTELGLTFGDIRNSLLVLCVVKIQTVTGPFLRSNLGWPQKEA
jgi:hypothetical protein